MLAFACAIICYLNNLKYIVVSNEASANEGNIAGTTINHQYSKSYEFEKDFNDYLQTYLCEKMQYFRLLRCMNEFQIVQKFVKFPSYLKIFRSCNVGTKTNSWCGHCAKCLYVYIMLYPFVGKDRLVEIFGRDLLDDETMGQIFVGLINPDTTKPFECVGTREEIDYALRLELEKLTAEGVELPKLIAYYRDNFFDPSRTYNIVNYFNPQHHIPDEYLKLILSL